MEETPPGRMRRALRATSRWFTRQRDDLVRDALIGFIVLGVGFIFAAWWDSRLADRQSQFSRDLATASEIQENTRFVRQVVIDNAAAKPFRGLNLRSAALSGLDLGCENAAARAGCADLQKADLSRADLAGIKLTGANLEAADLTGAFLLDADLADANLQGTKLAGAFLSGADLTGANLASTDLTGAWLRDADLPDRFAACYDNTTFWPDGFTPPSPACNSI